MGPILEKISNWWKPKPAPTPTPTPAPISPPDPTSTPIPTPTVDTPSISRSNIQLINYVRALMILKQIPLKKLREEFLKLPLQKIAYTIGVFIWAIMTYLLLKQLLQWALKHFLGVTL
jgi:hypothetical protein